MAILRQQVSFVEQLFLSGMVAASEREEMLEPLEERVRELHRRGAVWRPPLLLDVRLSALAPPITCALDAGDAGVARAGVAPVGGSLPPAAAAAGRDSLTPSLSGLGSVT